MASALVGQLTLSGGKTKIPALLYGTAWKKERTKELVVQALRSGFLGVDTAAQPKHYREDLVGDALRQAFSEGTMQRPDVYLQTKFTPVAGQDKSDMPYNPLSPVPEQVRASVASSLHNFRNPDEEETYLDCLVLHSPLSTLARTLEVWETLEEYVPHKIRNLGISNVELATLQRLYAAAKIKPAVVQNRFYPKTKFDLAMRKFCRENNIVYQSFWTLTANPKLLASEPVGSLAVEAAVDNEIALYCLVLGLGNTVVLDGTTNEGRMRGDMQGLNNVRRWVEADDNRQKWDSILSQFKALIQEP
ncbi:hypothetical protein FGG08_004273 [Glutinoglossum americanum]|uniref:NADP-dependent oxidoreductase domain-containing protein n=1 Tax=Glutinoglossum americanum TaxID=1670608 RepID=A0A9P8IBP3_9PEZI|nr:hypothetical protein FGG08_004273 [Glutinoglossum americanum]